MTKRNSKTAASPKHTPPKVGRLTSINSIRRELAALYKDARQGRAQASEASKLGYLLKMLSDIIRDSELEARLDEIEKRMERQR